MTDKKKSLIYGCLRCHKDYCMLCNPPEEITFSVKDGVYHKRDYQSLDEFKRLNKLEQEIKQLKERLEDKA
ncbi:MAG: hypothetical protein IIC11_11465 [Proteobacteria bacterium]|nr:hypothetical protein [Pseudomonadota bacterium]